ncbi:MAG: ferritin family protein [Planctomycetota bacterium]|jgi:rubrerythrin
MAITFNADEIFEMAEQIERNGIKFYRRAAEIISDKDNKDLLLRLAEMEVEHEKTFAQMREELTGKENESIAFDPDNQAALYLQAVANGHVFDMKTDPSALLSGQESFHDILKMAIGAEKDSIAFYMGLKDSVPAPAGKDKVDKIIREEMNHIVLLSGKL